MKSAVLALISVCVVLTGCGSKADENYTTDVKLTPEQQQKKDELMAGQKMPGSAPEPGAGPSALTVPGKGGK